MDYTWQNIHPVVHFTKRLDCDPNFSFGPRFIHDHQFIYIISGTGSANIEGRNYVANAGDLFYYGPGIVHYFEASKETPFSVYGLHFSLDGELPEKGGLQYVEITKVTEKDNQGKSNILVISEKHEDTLQLTDYVHLGAFWIESLFSQIIELYHRGNTISPLWNRTLFLQLLFKLQEHISTTKKRNSNVLNPVFYVREQLHLHVKEPYSRNWLRKWTSFHEDHVSRLFRGQFGTSPHDYFMKQKIALAQKMVFQTEASINEISIQLHFSSIHYFSRLFKQLTGLSPSAYRRLSRII